MARVEIGLISALKSCQDVCEAASYRIGGKNSRKITSGFSSIAGRPGINQRLNPTITSNTALGSLILFAIAWSARRTAKMIRIIPRLFIGQVWGPNLLHRFFKILKDVNKEYGGKDLPRFSAI